MEVVISFTAKVPVVAYECDGADSTEVVLSPNFHRLVKVPELMDELLVNVKLLFLKHCAVSAEVKLVTGFGLTYRFFVTLSKQPELEAISLTEKVPGIV